MLNFLRMGRIIAIDYGQKRIGLAVTDPLQISANGLDTVGVNEIFEFLTQYLSKEKVDKFIIGLPKQLNGKESESMQYIRPFAKALQKKFPETEQIFIDERFTSVLAHKTMLEAGLTKKKRQNKQLADKISAVIILQSYLESYKGTT